MTQVTREAVEAALSALRKAPHDLRRTPVPLSDYIPMIQNAAALLQSLWERCEAGRAQLTAAQAEVKRLNEGWEAANHKVMVEHDRAVQAEFERDSAKAELAGALTEQAATIAQLQERVFELEGQQASLCDTVASALRNVNESDERIKLGCDLREFVWALSYRIVERNQQIAALSAQEQGK